MFTQLSMRVYVSKELQLIQVAMIAKTVPAKTALAKLKPAVAPDEGGWVSGHPFPKHSDGHPSEKPGAVALGDDENVDARTATPWFPQRAWKVWSPLEASEGALQIYELSVTVVVNVVPRHVLTTSLCGLESLGKSGSNVLPPSTNNLCPMPWSELSVMR